MKIDWKQLYSDLDFERREREASWRSLGKELGIPPATFTRLKEGRALKAETFMTLVNTVSDFSAETYTYDQ